MAERDPHQEPENSTVNDWHGQKVDKMMEDADKRNGDTNDVGDVTAAEEDFNEATKD